MGKKDRENVNYVSLFSDAPNDAFFSLFFKRKKKTNLLLSKVQPPPPPRPQRATQFTLICQISLHKEMFFFSGG